MTTTSTKTTSTTEPIDHDSCAPSTTVRFNVGGQLFEVSTSLIEQNIPDSMLASMISKRWTTATGGGDEGEGGSGKDDDDDVKKKEEEEEDNSDDGSPPPIIFIDRNSIHFGHMLDYLRYGSVRLPITVSKKDFLRDLDYFGVPVVMAASRPTTTSDGEEGEGDNDGTIVSESRSMMLLNETTLSKIIQKEMFRRQNQKAVKFLVNAIAKETKCEAGEVRFCDPNGVEGEVGWKCFEKVFLDKFVPFDQEQFDIALSEFDLVFVKTVVTWGSVYVHVDKKKKKSDDGDEPQTLPGWPGPMEWAEKLLDRKPW